MDFYCRQTNGGEEEERIANPNMGECARFLFRSFNPIKFEFAFASSPPFGNVAEWPEKEKLQAAAGKADVREMLGWTRPPTGRRGTTRGERGRNTRGGQSGKRDYF